MEHQKATDIIVVGLSHKEDLFTLTWIYGWLREHRSASPLNHRRLQNREYEVFDMATLPEKGDALDAIGPGTKLVIALHLFGIDKEPGGNTAMVTAMSPDRCYNRCNIMMLPLCMRQKATLIAVGDQPWMGVEKEETMHEDAPLIRIYEPRERRKKT